MLNKSLLQSLKQTCDAPIEAFRALGDYQSTPDGQLVWIDNGADTLGVAHLDYVLRAPASIRGHKVYCPQLDDRLGAWVLLFLLPELGVNCDILLTDNEEIGRSTARYFQSPVDYNWMFEFDRRGTDTVLYDYDSRENRELLEGAGFDVGFGSFSDICYLDHLGITGFNIGTGYYREHSRECWGNLIETLSQAHKFAEFWEENQDLYLPSPALDDWRPDTIDPDIVDDEWSYTLICDSCEDDLFPHDAQPWGNCSLCPACYAVLSN